MLVHFDNAKLGTHQKGTVAEFRFVVVENEPALVVTTEVQNRNSLKRFMLKAFALKMVMNKKSQSHFHVTG
jgi:hypothetical protein